MKALLVPILAAALVAPAIAAEFQVSSLKLVAPKDWKQLEPTSPMRKAEFTLFGEKGDAELVFFYFGQGGAGGVEANVERWYGQFKEPKDDLGAKSEKAKAGDFPVTYATARGTFMSGPPLGEKVAMPDHALLGAIVEHPDGAVFAKLTGPIETVEKHAAAFKTMIEAAK